MKDKRQGNDLKVAWSIFMQDGEPFRLEGLDVSLYLKNMFGRKPLNDFVVTGNIIQWTFYGKDQKNTGKYSLEMVINEGEKGMITTDKCDFVNLVDCSCKLQGGEDAPNVETESIELTSTLEYVSGGGEYDDTALWKELENKVDKVEGLGLSEENYTNEEKEKLAGLENYDDSGIKEDLAKKAYKSEIPTKMSQLEQDIEIGGEVDLSDYPTREEVSETYLPREEFEERIEGYATHDSVQELSENVTELSARVGELEEGGSGESEVFYAEYGVTTYNEIIEAHNAKKEVLCKFQNRIARLVLVDDGVLAYFQVTVGSDTQRLVCYFSNIWDNIYFNNAHKLETLANGNAKITIAGQSSEVATPQYVENAIQQSGGGASNEWKCVYDGRMEVGANEWVFSTYADGTPLKAEEVVVQVIMDNDTTKTTQGYVRVQSSTNKSETYYGAFFIENPNNNGFIAMSQVRLKASPFIMVAEMYDNLPLKVAQGVNCVGRLGKDVYQIYEDITLVRISATTKIAEAAPLLKIYAR